MEELVQLIGSVNAGIDGALGALDDEVSQLRGNWTGAASNAYDKAQVEWTNSLAGMNRVLDSVRNATSEINSRHRAAEDGVKGIWG